MRRYLRAAVTGVTVGAVALGSAFAGSVVSGPGLLERATEPGGAPTVAAPAPAAAGAAGPAPAVAPSGERLPAGWFLAGSATATLVPPADRWVQGERCAGHAPEQLYTPLTPEGCLITFDMLWANGVDEENPIMVRSVALSNGVDTVVFTVMDVVGYMASYPADLCADCGIAQVTKKVAAELGIPEQNLIVSSSHTHAAPSTIAKGAAWYYRFVRDQLAASITAAVAGLRANPPVRLETGATAAKPFNTDRRIVNRAVPDFELGWLRAFVPAGTGQAERTVATIGNFAVHPTVRAGNARLHSGIVGPFTSQLRKRLGGAGLFLPGAIGDQRVDRAFGIHGIGAGLADSVADDVARGGRVLRSNDLEVARTAVQVPVENQFFAAALAVGYAVRDISAPFGGGPHTAVARNSEARKPVCQQTAPLHVVTPVSAVRIGERPPAGKREVGEEHRRPVETDNVVIVQAPGEIFASIGLIAKDYLSRSDNVLVQGLTNDTIGYIIPHNQYDAFASQGAGVANNSTGVANYEEALSLGACTGELITNAMLEVGRTLGVMGEGEAP